MASLSATIFNFIVNLMGSLGYAGVFALMVMESATLPVPSEVVLPLAGYLVASQGLMDFWVVVILASVGSLIGTLIDYAIGFWLGRAVVLRYGRYVRLSEKHLATSEAWFKKYGNITVLFARFVPLIRTLVAFPAGIAEMSIGKFVAYSVVGIFIWDLLLVYLGFQAGQNYELIINTLNAIFLPLEIAALIITALALVIYARRRSRIKKQVREED